ncbi:MAG: ABC transporter permease [Dehalococcoidia bacterium]|nr:ABC transporter permease [Dehalococcoidia bacterium]
MQQYILRRILLAIPTLIGVSILIFLVMRVLPGDPLQAMVDEESGPTSYTEEQKEVILTSLGLNRPLYQQYFSWMLDIARGDLGFSFWRDTPIRETIQRRGPITAEIGIFAVIISWVVGLPVGMIGAIWRNSFTDYVSRFTVTFFLAAPSFWLGLGFIVITVMFFTWRPPINLVQIWEDPWRNLQMTLPPAFAVGLGMAAIIARMSRATLLEVFREDYVRTALAKGLGQQMVVWRHVMRNAMLPVITVSGLQLANLLGGSVAVERAFSVPGLGAALAQAMNDRDWMVMQNLVLLFAVIFVVINLIVDLAYALIDPRIRFQ